MPMMLVQSIISAKPFDDVRFAKALARAKAALNLNRTTGDVLDGSAPSAVPESSPGRDRLLVNEDPAKHC